MPPKKSEPKPSPEGPTFEQAIERLEGIVGQMESGQLPLAELLERYAEGVDLVQACTRHLDAAERRVEVITRGAAGGASSAPLDGGPDETATPPESVSLF
jgi:exodeoxyribonuclease VII small subunit